MIFFKNLFLVWIMGYLFSPNLHAAENHAARGPQVLLIAPEKATLSKEAFYANLSEKDKLDFESADKDTQNIILIIASTPELKHKGMAIRIAKELGWGNKETIESKENANEKKASQDNWLTDLDRIIVRKIRHSYEEHTYPDEGKNIDPNSLAIAVQNGEVTLKGSMPTAKQKASLLSWVKLIKGVKSINDQITIK